MDKLTITPIGKNYESCLRKPLMVSADVYDAIESIAKEVGYKKGVLGDVLIKFALERLEVNDSTDD